LRIQKARPKRTLGDEPAREAAGVEVESFMRERRKPFALPRGVRDASDAGKKLRQA
jgi:hypothetical protein